MIVQPRIIAIFAAGIALGSAHIAQAADLPPAKPAPVYRAPAVVPVAFSWSGCYLGANGGGHFGKEKLTTSTTAGNGFPSAAAIDAQSPQIIYPNGGTIGGQLGCNVQFGMFVAGVEGDGQWMIDSKTSRNIGFFPPATLGDSMANTFENTWFATARLRLGVAFDRTLIYATGGGAFAGIKITDTFNTFAGTDVSTVSKDDVRIGWTVGGGIEQALSLHWTVKAEYLYSDLGTVDVSIPCIATCTTSATDTVVHHRYVDHNVRVGLNLKW